MHAGWETQSRTGQLFSMKDEKHRVEQANEFLLESTSSNWDQSFIFGLYCENFDFVLLFHIFRLFNHVAISWIFQVCGFDKHWKQYINKDNVLATHCVSDLPIIL